MYVYSRIRQVHLEITSRCNASCPMCPRNVNGGALNPNLPLTELSLSDVKTILPAAFVRQLSGLLRHTGVCRAQMEDGSMRVDVNVSVRREGEEVGGERVEVKNLNSIRSVVRAIEHELQRQSDVRGRGEAVKRETASV